MMLQIGKWHYLAIFYYIFSVSFCLGQEQSVAIDEPPIPLTKEERDWLSSHPEIKLAPDPEFLPIEYINENGEYLGIAADFVTLIERKLEIKFSILRCETWDEVLEKSKARQVDMWGAANAYAPTPRIYVIHRAFNRTPGSDPS